MGFDGLVGYVVYGFFGNFVFGVYQFGCGVQQVVVYVQVVVEEGQGLVCVLVFELQGDFGQFNCYGVDVCFVDVVGDDGVGGFLQGVGVGEVGFFFQFGQLCFNVVGGGNQEVF